MGSTFVAIFLFMLILGMIKSFLEMIIQKKHVLLT